MTSPADGASGRLVLVSTPIGNLGDLPPRAVEELRGAALICCEDTRRTGTLLAVAGVSGVRLAVCNEHTEAACAVEVLALLATGSTVAVVTDAGTPGISDPGERLVRAAVAAGHTVTAVPGPAALVMALVVSGFDAGRFVFEGFLPRAGAERARRIAGIAAERRTTICYEAPHRVERTVADLAAACGGDRRVALARELTKRFEEIWRGTLDEAVAHLAASAPRGEYVVVVEAAAAPDQLTDDDVRDALVREMGRGIDRRTAITTVVDAFHRDGHRLAKRRVYDIALTLPRP